MCVRTCASLCLIELMRKRIGCRRARRGEFPHDQTLFFSFYTFPHAAPHLQRTGECAVMAQVSPVWKVFKIHANISTPVRQMEDLPNSFHASTWQRANRRPLEGGRGLGLRGGGDWSLSITILWTCQIIFFNSTFIRYTVIACFV